MKSKEKKLLVFSACILLVCSIGLSVYAVIENNNKNEVLTQLENSYRRSLFDAVESIRSTELDLSKLLITSNDSVTLSLLTKLSLKGASAQQDLSLLPVINTQMQSALKFFNQLSAYCASMVDLLNANQPLPNSFHEQIYSMFRACGTVKSELIQTEDAVTSGNLTLVSLNSSINGYNEPTSGMFSGLTNKLIEYPTVIFDGPFSDGELQNTPVQPREEVSSEKAAETLFFCNVEFSNKSDGIIPCYNFSGNSCFASVSVEGGLLLSYINNRACKETKLNENQAQKFAFAFVKKLALGESEVVWHESFDHTMTFSFAPVSNNVTMYPDIFKVKVALDNGEVLSFEGKNYFMNNTPRKLDAPAVTAEQAQSALKKELTAKASRLCIIPLNGSEELCWEFFGEYKNLKYAVYVSALDGTEKTAFRIINTETGEMTA